MGQFHLKISPKNEKTDRRSGRRRIKKMVGIARFELATFCPPDKRANQAALYPVSKTKFNIQAIRKNANSIPYLFSLFIFLHPFFLFSI